MLSREDKQNFIVGSVALAFVFLLMIALGFFGKVALTVDSEPPHTISEWANK